MSHLRVRVLGGMTIAIGGQLLPIAGSCRPVLGYLLTFRQRRVSRLELAEAVWGNREREYARRCLSTALWRLKRSTNGGPELLSLHEDEEISFNWTSATWVDCVALEKRVAPLLRQPPESLTKAQIAHLERGVRLYRGDYLVGMDQDWAMLERQRVRSLFCDGLHRLMLAHACRSQWSAVLEWGRSLTREEPLREDVHRLLMTAYARTGNRASALALYKQCERVLATELSVTPMAETKELYAKLMQDSSPQFELEPRESGGSLLSARHRIGRVRRALAASQQQLDQALTALGSGPSAKH